MGDVGEAHKAYKNHLVGVRLDRKYRNEPFLELIGARFLTDGVYRYENWDAYPEKDYVRDFKTGQTMGFRQWRKMITKQYKKEMENNDE